MKRRLLKSVLSRISKNKLSRAAASKVLGCSERQVNRLMLAHGVERPPGRTHERRLTAKMRREAKERGARGVLQGVYDEPYAALTAGCSVRTIYRWKKKLQKQRKSGPKCSKTARK